jgi:DNA-binding response OmpR family regulator
VVFLDLNMPRLDGHEVLRRIRADAELCAMRVIILTSSDRPADMTQSRELGADAHVIKPVAVSDLITRLHAVSHLWIESASR